MAGLNYELLIKILKRLIKKKNKKTCSYADRINVTINLLIQMYSLQMANLKSAHQPIVIHV